MKETTSRRLKYIMRERNLKQVDIIEKSKPYQNELNVSLGKSALSQYVSGKSSPDQYKLTLLSKTLNVSQPWLMGYDVPMVEENTKKVYVKQQLNEVFDELKEKRQLKVVSFAKSELDEQNKVVEISEYQTEKEYPYYDDAVSAGTGQYIGISQRDTITLPVDFNADYVVPVNGNSMEPEYYDGDYIFIESTVNVSDGEIGVFEYYGDTYVKQLILEDDHAYLHSLNKRYKDMLVDADSDFRVLGRVVGRYAEKWIIKNLA